METGHLLYKEGTVRKKGCKAKYTILDQCRNGVMLRRNVLLLSGMRHLFPQLLWRDSCWWLTSKFLFGNASQTHTASPKEYACLSEDRKHPRRSPRQDVKSYPFAGLQPCRTMLESRDFFQVHPSLTSPQSKVSCSPIAVGFSLSQLLSKL